MYKEVIRLVCNGCQVPYGQRDHHRNAKSQLKNLAVAHGWVFRDIGGDPDHAFCPTCNSIHTAPTIHVRESTNGESEDTET